jgi:two-component system, sensor histidine kinase and response regulator
MLMLKTASVLVVDDENSNFDVIEILLFKDGHQLHYASCGNAALAWLDQSQPDVILLDVMMPDRDGMEVCRLIKSNPLLQHIPVIMVTALNSKESLERCLEAGADDFVGKPINGAELRARIRSMLRIKQQYDALEKMVQMQEASLQMREDMSNMIVHDLRNPLTNIVLSSQLLKLCDLSEKQQRKVEQIEYAGRRLQSLIDSLLMMAKLESGKMLLNRAEVDLGQMAQETIADFQEIAVQQQIVLVSQIPERSEKFWIDQALIRRVLDNLLSNALKFSPANTEVTLAIDYLSETQVQIQVKDMGHGVSEALQQRIFEKYEVGEVFQGVTQVGLGLAFCKMAIAAHGGRIFVKERQPKGAIFTIELEHCSVYSTETLKLY